MVADRGQRRGLAGVGVAVCREAGDDVVGTPRGVIELRHDPHGGAGTQAMNTPTTGSAGSWQVGAGTEGQAMTPVGCHFSPGNTFATEALNRLDAMSASTWR